MENIIQSFVVLSLLLPGPIMVFIPFVPGLPYMMLTALIFKLVGVSSMTFGEIGILLGITILSVVVDWSAGLLGAKYGGARLMSLAVGFVGAVIGLLVFPPFGGLVGLFLGILFAEWGHKDDSLRAINAAGSALIGTVLGMVLNFCLAVLFLGLSAWFLFS